MITDPRFAPKRTDLPWLRRRRLPKAALRGEPEQEQHAHEALAEFVIGHATHTHPEPTPAPSAAASSGLDLDEPTPAAPPPAAPATPPAPAASSSSLDLDEPAAPRPAPAAPRTSSLDLDEPTPEPARRVAPPQPESSQRRVRTDVRVRAGARVLLTVAEPTVTLTRLQSGIGTVTFEAACSDEVGDLRIGCGYELASGPVSTVQLTQGNRTAPANSRRPVLLATHERFETMSLDLRQSTDLRRLIVYAFSESRQPLQWGGTLITTSSGGARVELALDSLVEGDVAVLLSLYNVHGEFVLRAEMQTLYGGVREACRAYGYDRITWLDDRTPVG